MSERAQWLQAGVVGRPHGLDGSFLVVEANPDVLVHGAVVRVEGHERVIDRRAGTDQRIIVRLEGCADRDSANALRGARIEFSRDAAPALEGEEWWAEDLEGCLVYDGERRVGTVRRLLALPSCEVLEVSRDEEGEDLLVPLVADAVRTVDVDARRIDVDLQFLGEA